MQTICDAQLSYGKIFIYFVADKTGFELLTTEMVCLSDGSLVKMREQGYIR